ncbi:MAG: alanine racemase [Patescibacteria group bacterium]|nr:alanine racemase [Patescibacteria group bacterium]MDD4304395.1 alanine racemase [Patescibacteria group bacterium]MDD4695418.1 alanine racemase [Patescibacteria group bacterium]
MEYHNSWIEISRKNLEYNIKSHKKLLDKNVKLMAVVKSNAYGHGIVLISKILDSIKEVDILATVNLEEAILLRKNNIKKPILVLSYYGITENREVFADQIKFAIKNNISLMVYDMSVVKIFDDIASKLKKRVKIHIKVETGMARVGVKYEDAIDFIKTIKKLKNIDIKGLASHFATTEESNQYFANYQLNNFKSLIDNLEKEKINIPIKHMAASAAINMSKKNHFDAVRLGVSMYGLWASEENKKFINKTNNSFKLKPVLSWKTKLFQIKDLKADVPVGYGCTYRTTSKIKMGLIPVGYFEGLDRRFSNNGEVLVNGKICNIIGRICMNIAMIDITGLKAKVGDEVVIIGKQGKNILDLEYLSKKIDTINYELVTRLNSEIPRIIID